MALMQPSTSNEKEVPEKMDWTGDCNVEDICPLHPIYACRWHWGRLWKIGAGLLLFGGICGGTVWYFWNRDEDSAHPVTVSDSPPLTFSELESARVPQPECVARYELVKDRLKPVKDLHFRDEDNRCEDHAISLTCTDNQDTLYCYDFALTEWGLVNFLRIADNHKCVFRCLRRKEVNILLAKRLVETFGKGIVHTNSSDWSDIAKDVIPLVEKEFGCEWSDSNCKDNPFPPPPHCQCKVTRLDFWTFSRTDNWGSSTVHLNKTGKELAASFDAATKNTGYRADDCISTCYTLKP